MREHTMEMELEYGRQSVTYLVVYTVSPGEPARGPSYSSGGEPGYPPSVEDVSVFYVHKRAGKTVKEPRPELEALVSEEELLEHAGEVEQAEAQGEDEVSHDEG